MPSRALSECGCDTHHTQEAASHRWRGVQPTDLSGQSFHSCVGCGHGRFQKRCPCPHPSAVARRCRGNSSEPGDRSLAAAGPPWLASPAWGLHLPPARRASPRGSLLWGCRSHFRGSGSSSGSRWEEVAGPRGSGTGEPPLQGCTLTGQSSPGQGVEEAAWGLVKTGL